MFITFTSLTQIARYNLSPALVRHWTSSWDSIWVRINMSYPIKSSFIIFSMCHESDLIWEGVLLFAQGTFKERHSLVYSKEGVGEEVAKVARDKYVARGWEMVKTLTEDEIIDPTSAFDAGSHYVGDSKCWTIPIFPKLQLPEGYIETNSWKVFTLSHVSPKDSWGMDQEWTSNIHTTNFQWIFLVHS